MTRVAFLGVGAMGSRMARRLLSDHELTVYNRSAGPVGPLVEAGARSAETPRAAVADAAVVISMLTDDAAAAAVWLDAERGACGGLAPGTLVLECSTVTPVWISRLASAVHDRQARLLDAPVAGSTPQAEAGQLVFLVGGAEPDVAEATPLMLQLGQKVLHVGAQTQGTLLKLAVNALFAGQVALMAELLRALDAHGLSTERAVSLLSGMPVTSAAAAGAATLMLSGDHAPRFPVDLVVKDLGYAALLGALPVVDAVRARYLAAAEAGHGDKNLCAVHLVS